MNPQVPGRLGYLGTIEETGESDWTSFTPLRGRQRMDLVMKA